MTYLESRWGLQWLAEETIGRRIAELGEREDAQFAAAKKALGG